MIYIYNINVIVYTVYYTVMCTVYTMVYTIYIYTVYNVYTVYSVVIFRYFFYLNCFIKCGHLYFFDKYFVLLILLIIHNLFLGYIHSRINICFQFHEN